MYIIPCLIYYSGPFSFPAPKKLNLISMKLGQLTFMWESNMLNCSVVYYKTTSDCGSCLNETTANTTATCQVPMLTTSCSFAVQSIICGYIEGMLSKPLVIDVNFSSAGTLLLATRYLHMVCLSVVSRYKKCLYKAEWLRNLTLSQSKLM